MLSDVSVLVTAWRRPYYLRSTLAAWARVEGIRHVRRFAVALGEHPATHAEQLKVIEHAELEMDREISVWPDSPRAVASPGMHRALGEAASRVFADRRTGFTVFGEEDVVPSADVLEYMSWARASFEADRRVLLACAHNRGGQGWDAPGTDDAGADPAVARLEPYFHPWIWGTWPDRWHEVLEPQWEWDVPPAGPPDSGYDWNIATRVIPRGGYLAVVPDASHSQNIGQDEGVYAVPGNYASTVSLSFREDFGPVAYRLAT